MTNCPSCAFAYQPTSTPPMCPACGAVAPIQGGFAPPPMGGVPGESAYAPGAPAPYGGPQQPFGAPTYGPQAYPQQAPQGYGPQGYGPQGYGPQGFAPGYGMPPVRDLDVGWLLWGGIARVFCCQPLGIASLIFMDQAKSAHRIGDEAKAQAKLSNMRLCVYIGLGLSLAIVGIYVVGIIISIVGVAASGP